MYIKKIYIYLYSHAHLCFDGFVLLYFPQDLGIPLAANIKIQLNLVMKMTQYVRRVEKFNGLTLPICWLKLVRTCENIQSFMFFFCFLRLTKACSDARDGIVFFIFLSFCLNRIALKRYR